MAKPTEEEFIASIREYKIPILVLDQKWHHLFLDTGKPESIQSLEKEVDALLQRQGALTAEIKDLKVAKGKVMNSVIATMDETDADTSKKNGEQNMRLINEINEKIEADEDELLDLPNLLKDANEKLMMRTMDLMYDRLHKNGADVAVIKEWIANMRVELKKNIIRKQNMETKNQEIYGYMHDIFGAKVLDLFDVQNSVDKEEGNL